MRASLAGVGSRQKQGDRMRRGFTLIEVLLATLLLSVGMTSMLMAASRCLAVIRVAKAYQSAQWALNLGELEHPVLPTDDYTDWEVPPTRYDNITYERTVQEPEGYEDGLFILRSRASWSIRGRESYEEIVRLVFDPDEAEFLKP